MSSLKHFIITSLIAVVLTGCATSFQKATPNTDYGVYPSDYQNLVKGFMETALIDPESARYRFEAPRKAYAVEGLLRGGKISWTGFAVKFVLNAKNRVGGYTGGKEYVALIRDGTVVKAEEANDPVLRNLLKYSE